MQPAIHTSKASSILSGVHALKKVRNTVIWVIITIYALLTLYPLIWLFISAFKTNEEFFSRPFGLPTTLHFENFTRAWKVAGMGTAFVNSIVVTAISLVLTLLIGALASFILARFNFRFKTWVLGLFVLGMLIPVHSTLVPLFILLKQMGLLDSRLALILPYIAFELPIALFIITAFMSAFPKEIEEAALIDGAGYWGIFGRIMLPLSMPALSTVAILAFLRFWNDYAFALVFISKPSLKTLPLSLSVFSDGFGSDYKLTLAALSLSVIPTLVIYVIFQEKIMKGMLAGSVKG
ncbi:carbohydrate ABC transporter permease [Paenibacillus sp. N1-5-1-14]|uniref:carbohydrate ABC transporter permease n=1 Tax=Paenibacillus radicibacter TaxID=2972488 RepID=UPI0021595C84|nr:carbohydrate ABC transporter permease [Paenibacillus radicibacter]MCR8642485.1 carbohydrate ABC transporter permease [Paenibacillus radicibacter]